MATYTVAKAREEFASLLDRVADDQEDIVITRHGTEVGVVIPITAYHLLQRMRRRIEDTLTQLAMSEVDAGNLQPFAKSVESARPAPRRSPKKVLVNTPYCDTINSPGGQPPG